MGGGKEHLPLRLHLGRGGNVAQEWDQACCKPCTGWGEAALRRSVRLGAEGTILSGRALESPSLSRAVPPQTLPLFSPVCSFPVSLLHRF